MENKEAYLPPEIIEKILSRLPAKSLLRFKGVCTPWKALISSHRFIHTHLLHSNASTSSYAISDPNLFIVRFQDGDYHVDVAAANLENTVLCSSNGVLLLQGPSSPDLIVWNPSIQKTTNLRFPFTFNGPCHHVLCYDPAAADLKVVVACWHSYAVYSCKNEDWSKHKGIGASPMISPRDEVFVDGAVYWICGSNGDLVCFESDGDKLKTVERPGDLKQGDEICLIRLRDRLCVWFCGDGESVVRVWMREEGDVWSDFMRIEDVPYPCYMMRPFYAGENEIRVYLKGQERVMVYRPRQKTFQEFDCPTKLSKPIVFASVDSLLFFDPQPQLQPRRSRSRRNRRHKN